MLFVSNSATITPPPAMVIAGDSHSVYPADGNGVNTWAYLLQNDANFSTVKFGQFAVGGSTWENVRDNQAPLYASSLPNVTLSRTVFWLQCERNDIVGGESAATLYAGLASLWAAAKSAGALIGTTKEWKSTGMTAPQLAVLSAVNAMFDTDPSLTFIVDGYSLFPDPTDLTYFQVDGLHLNLTGQTVLKGAISGAIQSRGFPP